MSTIHVAAGGNLQTAINSAAAGDDITLEAGATFTGNFTLPNKGVLGSYITIKSDTSPGNLPAAGVRIDPTYIPFCATIASSNTTPIFTAARGANHYKFFGINFPAMLNGAGTQLLIGGDFQTGTEVLADVVTDFAVDRCVFRGHVVAGQLRALYGGLTRFSFINNYCDRFGSQGQQGNIMCFANGEGEHDITNNYLSGSTQPILYGGAGIQAKVVTTVISATNSSAVLGDTTDLRVGQRISFLCEGGTRRRWPKCLTVNTGTNTVTFETENVVPDIPGDARWGVVEKGIRISRNYISHDPNVVINGVLMPTTGVSTSIISGNFAAGTATYQVQGFATGYTGQEARGAASAATSPVTIADSQGVRIAFTPVTNATSHYVYRTMGGIITRFTTGTSSPFDDVGTGGTVVASVPKATVFVGWEGMELKQGIDVHIHSNIFEWTYKGSFGGEGLLIKCANQDTRNSFLSTENVLVENNLFRHTFGCTTVSGSEAVPFSMDVQPKPVQDLTFRNNLYYDSSSANLGANIGTLSRYAVYVENAAKNVQFLHNTFNHVGTGGFFVNQSFTTPRGNLAGLVIRDNMIRANTYLATSDGGFGTAALQYATDGFYTFEYNAISNPTQTVSKITGGTGNQYEDITPWLAEFSNSAGTNPADFALKVGSTFDNDASDATDIGCDVPALEAAILDVTTGGAASGGATSPNIVTTILPNALPATVYDQTLVVSGGATPYAWTMTSGALPPGIAMSGYATAIVATSGLLAYWRLNETSGTIAYNHIAGTDGTYINTPTLGVAGFLTDGDKAAQFNGTNEYALIGNVATYRPTSVVSVEAIIKPAALTGGVTQNIAGVGDPSTGYLLRLVGSEARFLINGTIGAFPGLVVNTTYHIVGVYDGAHITVYINGVAGTPVVKTGAISYGATTDFVIGQRTMIPAGQYFNGVIDEVSVYSVALSGGTISAHYAAIAATTGPQILGTPRVASGVFTFTARVTDNAAAVDSQALSITVAAPLSVPVITTSNPLPNAAEGDAYTTTLMATDGVPPYSWAVSSGALPPGLNLNVDTGVISGTPVIAGNYSFTVGLSDSANVDAVAQALSIAVIGATTALPVGRPVKWNNTESAIFRRPAPPTIADNAVTGDLWIKNVAGLKPEPFLIERSGVDLTMNAWPTNDAAVRQIVQQEQSLQDLKVSYLPVWTGSGSAPSVGNGTIDGVYSQVGKVVRFRIRLVLGSTSVVASTGDWTFTLPVAADIDSTGSAYAKDVSAPARYAGGLEFPTTTTVRVFVSGGNTFWGVTTPFTWASTDILVISGSYWTA